MHVHVLNGVNLGMLGTREPDVYGKMALNELESRVYAWARELGLTARCMQTDHEGEYIQAIHEAIRTAGALIVNPGAWTHYSYAIRDALAMLSTPIVEVHMSDVNNREPWRRISVIEDVVTVLGSEVQSHGVTLRFEPASHLPPVLADRIQLQQVILNLLLNGIEAMSEIHASERQLRIIDHDQDASMEMKKREGYF